MDGSNLRSLLTNHGGYFRRHCGTTIRYWGVTSDSWIDFDDRDFDAQEHQRWPYSDGTAPDTKYGAGYTLLPDTVETRFATWHVAVAGRFFDVRTISDTLTGLLHRVESEPENDAAWAALQDCIEEETGISVRLAENRVRDEGMQYTPPWVNDGGVHDLFMRGRETLPKNTSGFFVHRY